MLKVRQVVCTAMLLLLLVASAGYAQEFRSIEITAWGSGFESASACTALVNYADSCNLNCIIPELRLRCDAYYNSNFEPPGTGVAPSPAGFDSLADLITKAHAAGIEVHPWVVTFRVWTTVDGPAHMSPEHIWYTHGPGQSDPDEDWLMYSDTGAWSYGGVSNLDPGVPAVEDYLISVFMDMVNNYDVDGLNLDYIRYPQTSWGYNPKAVARFNAEYGLSGNPSSSNTTWQNWRRDQISNLVKRLYLEIKAVKPWVKLSADVWNSATTGNNSYFQNWDHWMANHWLDFAHPMSYTSTNSTFSGWCDAYVNNAHGRHVYPLVDASNSITGNVLPQIDSVRTHDFAGTGLYAYSSIPNKSALQSALVSGPFPTAVGMPDMPWLSTPTLGMLKGYVKTGAGVAIYPATVTIQSRNTKNTGTGFYGFVDLTTGTYTVTASAPGYVNVNGQVTITAGQVATLNLTMGSDTTPPTISNVRTANVQATNAQVLWDTNEGATSQVEYGLTTGYGNQTTENMALVTAHTVQLVNLTGNTLYHYRVKSRDGAGNLRTSSDYTFTTAPGDTVADIIIDNTSATLVGSWTTGTSATDKYGTNYYYCTTAASETKSARWTPNIITAGNYDVYVWYPAGSNRTAMAPYTVYWNGGSQTYTVNQKVSGGVWNLIAETKPFAIGTGGSVKLGNGTGESALNVMADAVKFVYPQAADTEDPTVPTNLNAVAISGTQVDLTWTASTDNIGVTGYKIYRDSVEIDTSTTPSYSDTTCTSMTTYSYRVSAYDAASNESGLSTADVVTTPDSAPPTVPTNLSATAISQTQINLSWTASTDNVGVTGYNVYRDGDYLTTVAGASCSDTNCVANTLYTYQVTAFDAAGNESGLSTQASATTLASTDIVMDNPAAVFVGSWIVGTTSSDKYGADYEFATTAATETATATWTPNIGVSGYYVVYCWYPQGANRSSAAPYTVNWNGGSQTVNVNQTTGGGTWNTLLTNKRFLSGTGGSVKLGNGTGEASLVVLADAVRFLMVSDDLTAPTVPTNLSATAVSTSQINLTWTASTDNVAVTGYRIFRNDVEVGTSATTSFSDPGLTQYTTYTYKVAAYDEMGNESAKSSPDSETTWDGQAPTVPTNLNATPITSTRIDLTWTASTDNAGVTGYKIFRNSGQIGTSPTASYSDTTCSPNTTYSYEVSAYDARGNESAHSAADVATTPSGSLANIIIDNPAATFTGTWTTSTTGTDKYGTNYRWASSAVSQSRTAKWTPTIATAGGYDLYAWWSVGSNRATNSPYFCQWNGGSQTVNVNQTINGGAWMSLLTNKSFATGTAGFIRLGNGTGSTGKVVVADAVRFQQVN